MLGEACCDTCIHSEDIGIGWDSTETGKTYQLCILHQEQVDYGQEGCRCHDCNGHHDPRNCEKCEDYD